MVYGPRYRLTAYGLGHEQQNNLKALLDIYSAMALPLLYSGETPRHCKAVQLSTHEWLLPMRGRLGRDEQDWEAILRDVCFPARETAPTFVFPPAAMLCEARRSAEEAGVSKLYRRIPKPLRETLEPFQEEGVKFALRQGGRVLLADEMGLGKSLQALAVAAAYYGDRAGNGSFWPLLIVCPTSMRDVWVGLVEKWLEFVPASEICVLRRSMDMVTSGLVTIASYAMVDCYLREPISARHQVSAYKCIIIDESHLHLQGYKAPTEKVKEYGRVVTRSPHIPIESSRRSAICPRINRSSSSFLVLRSRARSRRYTVSSIYCVHPSSRATTSMASGTVRTGWRAAFGRLLDQMAIRISTGMTSNGGA